MRVASLVSIAFGLALAGGAQAQTGAKSPATAKTAASTTAGAKTPADAKGTPTTKAQPVARKKARTKSASAPASAATVSVATADTVRGASAVPVSGNLLGAATGAATASLLGASSGDASAVSPTSTGQALAMAPQLPKGTVTTFNPYGFPFPPGVYRCDLDRSVDVTQVAPDLTTAVVQWDKKSYTLHAVGARTGALRYEDAASGLTWLVIAGKSMLLDTRNGKQLANDCRV